MNKCKECKQVEDKKGILIHKALCKTYKKQKDALLKVSLEV